MRKPANVWQIWCLSKQLRIRPSELMALDPEDQLTVFCFDRAVTVFGTSLDNKLDAIEAKNAKEGERKRKTILNRWIPEERKAGEAGRFRDPAALKR